MNSIDPATSPCQTCTVCNVTIDHEDRVHFAFGPTGSRERLFARVCQHTQAKGCLNRNCDPQRIMPADCYGTGEENRQEFKKVQRLAQPVTRPISA